MKREIKHFKLSEFNCKCGLPACPRVKVAAELVFWLEVVRLIVKSPLIINSGYRCATHNKNVGGSAPSRHLIGCAADVLLRQSLRRDELLSVFNSLRGVGWEFIPYENFVHIAVPRESGKHLWDGGSICLSVN
jgi:hypothetical protein